MDPKALVVVSPCGERKPCFRCHSRRCAGEEGRKGRVSVMNRDRESPEQNREQKGSK